MLVVLRSVRTVLDVIAKKRGRGSGWVRPSCIIARLEFTYVISMAVER